MALMSPGERIGDYVVEKIIGRGGMAVVASARHVHYPHQVAISGTGWLARFRTLAEQLRQHMVQEEKEFLAVASRVLSDERKGELIAEFEGAGALGLRHPTCRLRRVAPGDCPPGLLSEVDTWAHVGRGARITRYAKSTRGPM